ncbi:unnamed protein product, partial [Iphiclides podalirius]
MYKEAHIGRVTGTLSHTSATLPALATLAAPSRGVTPLSARYGALEHSARLPTRPHFHGQRTPPSSLTGAMGARRASANKQQASQPPAADLVCGSAAHHVSAAEDRENGAPLYRHSSPPAAPPQLHQRCSPAESRSIGSTTNAIPTLLFPRDSSSVAEDRESGSTTTTLDLSSAPSSTHPE